MARGVSRKQLAGKFCSCVGSVRRTVKLRGKQKATPQAKESAAIAICTRSVLGTRGRTLRKIRCEKKPYLETQAPLKKTSSKKK